MEYREFWGLIKATETKSSKKDSLRKLKGFWQEDNGKKFKFFLERGTMEYMASKRGKGNL